MSLTGRNEDEPTRPPLANLNYYTHLVLPMLPHGALSGVPRLAQGRTDEEAIEHYLATWGDTKPGTARVGVVELQYVREFVLVPARWQEQS